MKKLIELINSIQ